ncbi:MAG: hypothetical protein ACRCZZ_08865 [Phocaeicola sp.]
MIAKLLIKFDEIDFKRKRAKRQRECSHKWVYAGWREEHRGTQFELETFRVHAYVCKKCESVKVASEQQLFRK